MRYSKHQQREMDAAYSARMDAYERFRATQPCKNKSIHVRGDGGCLRCNADCGEACRDPHLPKDP